MNSAKQAAAERAVEEVTPGMIVGLGTGTTAHFAIQALGLKVNQGLPVRAVASSVESESKAKGAGINIISFEQGQSIDIYIDGADEVDAQKNLIKGGGGALLREKILAYNSKRFMVIVDETKLSKSLGSFKLPVEIIPFAQPLTEANLKKLGCITTLRQKEGQTFVTDNGNWIIDCAFESIPDPAELNIQLHLIPGVVETGLFTTTLVSTVIIGKEDGSTQIL